MFLPSALDGFWKNPLSSLKSLELHYVFATLEKKGLRKTLGSNLNIFPEQCFRFGLTQKETYAAFSLGIVLRACVDMMCMTASQSLTLLDILRARSILSVSMPLFNFARFDLNIQRDYALVSRLTRRNSLRDQRPRQVQVACQISFRRLSKVG